MARKKQLKPGTLVRYLGKWSDGGVYDSNNQGRFYELTVGQVGIVGEEYPCGGGGRAYWLTMLPNGERTAWHIDYLRGGKHWEIVREPDDVQGR